MRAFISSLDKPAGLLDAPLMCGSRCFFVSILIKSCQFSVSLIPGRYALTPPVEANLRLLFFTFIVW